MLDLALGDAVGHERNFSAGIKHVTFTFTALASAQRCMDRPHLLWRAPRWVSTLAHLLPWAGRKCSASAHIHRFPSAPDSANCTGAQHQRRFCIALLVRQVILQCQASYTVLRRHHQGRPNVQIGPRSICVPVRPHGSRAIF